MKDIRPKLLIVEDDAGLQRQLRWAYDAYQLFIAGDREEALEILRAEAPDVITLDLGLPPDPDGTSEGFATLADILRIKPDAKVIVASGHGAHESALQAISGGAWDFYRKPIDIDELGLIVGRAFHVHALERENARLAEQAPDDRRVLGQIVAAAPEMIRAARTVERVAGADVDVLLLGASGTGKGLLARGLHDASGRRDMPFLTVNCSAFPEQVLASELFGGDKPSRIAQAQGGTLFLDEVGDMPLAIQAQLLQFLAQRSAGEGTDVRIVSATHHDMEALVREGAFRDDLYFRLAEVVVKVPSLSERPGDAVLLARHFLLRFARELNPTLKGFAPDALAAIDAWSWPGNVRELENRVKRAAIMADGKMVTAADLDLQAEGEERDDVINLKAARELADRRVIRRAMERADGNVSNAARDLGISRPTLYELMKQYGMRD